MRIYIIGSVGSGNTTLAKMLAKKVAIPRFETDQFVWMRQESGDIRKSEAVRDAEFKKAINLPEWVIEGVHIHWTDEGLAAVELILFLDVPPKVRLRRIIKRFIGQKIGTEEANYKPTVQIFRKMFGWNRYFEKQMKLVFMQKLIPYSEKTKIISTQGDLNKILEEIK
ncbi:DNA topology modulation protein FlaR [Planomicrobium sp. CPCC 101079]|uniref:DNA topology modulation protein FlaR n=1 Tax=Planomicrobium sp. CPCC 101079 TaxID=2599618 RepID=UPI0011B535F2|nr:DNA topology modulation protein FlaR [Planomicrobium sp. CPCC 101079]TWT09333.1 DNA topology modulation protein FlaR [Planomicrobium sp. CPCC 101079]